MIRRWKRDAGNRRRPRAVDLPASTRARFAMTDLPASKRARFASNMSRPLWGSAKGVILDPIRIIQALLFARHLRCFAEFSSALDDAISYENPDCEARSSSSDPSTASLFRGLERLDVVCMLLRRRQFKSWRLNDALRCINIYTDASPVTGEEFQGIVCDVLKRDGSSVRITLPTTSLFYGLANAVNKTIAMLWGIFLVVGPVAADLRYFLSKVVAVTTDGGIEIGTILMPDIVDAFLHWVAGNPLASCMGRIPSGTRLFPHALRISGWSHTYGNIAKSIVRKVQQWPDVLE